LIHCSQTRFSWCLKTELTSQLQYFHLHGTVHRTGNRLVLAGKNPKDETGGA
jgi:hypothetical protein